MQETPDLTGLLERTRRTLLILLGIAAVLLLFLLTAHFLLAGGLALPRGSPAEIAIYIDITSDIVTTVGVVAAAFWAYYHFARGRTFSTRADLDLLVTAVPLSSKHAVLSVASRVRNIGRARLHPSSCCLTINTVQLDSDGALQLCRVKDASAEDILTIRGRQRVRYYLDPEETRVRQTDILVRLDLDTVYQVSLDFRSRDSRCWTRTAIFRLGDRLPSRG